MTASLLTGRWKHAHPRAQVAHLSRVARRSTSRADWLSTMLGLEPGDPADAAFGYYPRLVAESPGDLDLRRSALVARQELLKARARALAASAEILVIAKVHRIRPDRLEVVRW